MGMERSGVTFASLMTLGTDLARWMPGGPRTSAIGRGGRRRRPDPRPSPCSGRWGRAPPSTSAPASSPSSCAPRAWWPWLGRRCKRSGRIGRARHRDLLPGGDRTVARGSLRRPPLDRVRVHHAARLPVRRQGRLRRRLLPGEGVPARGPARSAEADRRRRPQRDAAPRRRARRWGPVEHLTGVPRPLVRRPGARGRAQGGRPSRRAATTSSPTSTPVCAGDEGIGATARSVLLCRGRRIRPQLRTSRLRRRSRRDPRAACGERPSSALAAVSDRMVDAIDVMGDEDTVHGTMQAYAGTGVDSPVLMPLPWGADRQATAEATINAGIGKG